MSKDVLTDQAEKYFAPVREMQKLAVANVEKLVALQLASFKSYSKLGIDQMRAALEIRDVPSLQDFFARQGELFQTVAEKLVTDMKTVAELGETYTAEAQRIAKETVTKEGVTPSTRKAA